MRLYFDRSQFAVTAPHVRGSPESILQTVTPWSVEMKIPMWFAGNLCMATATVLAAES